MMRLYMHPFSQHSRRVLMLIHELGLDIEAVPVALERGEHKSADYMRISTTGLVPVLEDGPFRLAESHAIMRYLTAKTGDQAFYPAGAEARAEVDMWLDWNHTRLNPPVQALVIETMMKGPSGGQSLAERSRESVRAELGVLETGVATPRGVGAGPTLADLSIASTLALYEIAGADLSAHPAVASWYAEVKKRPSFAATAPRL